MFSDPGVLHHAVATSIKHLLFVFVKTLGGYCLVGNIYIPRYLVQRLCEGIIA